MEIILALVVISTVIFFGALISIGNERQRKAIDGVTEQIMHWTILDLRMKREKLARDIQIEDPLHWLSSIASKVSGLDLDLDVLSFREAPSLPMCTDRIHGRLIVFSSCSPRDVCAGVSSRHNRLSAHLDVNSEIAMLRKANSFNIPVFNDNMLFDLELGIVWKQLTNEEFGLHKSLWIYVN